MTRLDFPTKPSDVVELSMEDFEMAWAIGQAAASGTMPMKSPANRGSVRLEDGDEIQEIEFRDTIMSRMMFSMKDHFGDESPKWPAFMLRYWALQDLQSDPRMDRWVRQDGERLLFFEGLMEAAASLSLCGDKPGEFQFDPDEFFAMVEAVNESGKYRHTGEVW